MPASRSAAIFISASSLDMPALSPFSAALAVSRMSSSSCSRMAWTATITARLARLKETDKIRVARSRAGCAHPVSRGVAGARLARLKGADKSRSPEPVTAQRKFASN